MKIAIIDDHPLVRQGIVSILTKEENIEQIEQAANVEEALNLLNNQDIDVAMVDLKLAKEDGLQVIAAARKTTLKTKFVILTSFISKEDLKRAEKMEVDGYILKEAFAEDILYALRIISRGKKYYDPEILKQKQEPNDNPLMEQLTNREKDVLKLVAKGMNNEEIAKELYISEHTVKKHVSNILSKLNLSQRAQIVFMVNNKSFFEVSINNKKCKGRCRSW